MKSKKKIKQLKLRIKALEKIVSQDAITLTDANNPNSSVVMSFRNGNFSTDNVFKTETTTTENISNSNNLK